MRPGPKKPGESAAEYNARIKAMEQKWMSGPRGPKTGGGATHAGPRSGLAPKPGGGKPVMRAKGGMVKGKKC